MRTKVEAIILNTLNLGEADKLVTFFSRECGRLSGVAKNARKSFRRFGSGLELFSRSNIVIFEHEGRGLVRIESADMLHIPSGISRDLERLAAGSVMLELVREIAPEGDSNSGAVAFSLLADSIRLLGGPDDPRFLLRIFEIKFLSLMGFQPRLDRCVSCGGHADGDVVFHALKGGALCPSCMVSSGERLPRLSAGAVGFYYQALRMDMERVSRLKPSAAIMQELDLVFAEHMYNIIGKGLKSKQFLMQVQAMQRS